MADSINESNGIASAVPGEQKMRAADEHTENAVATKDDFNLSPVITVTKKEASFTKGDLKLQQVTVTEDISNDALMAEGMNIKDIESSLSEDNKNDAVNSTNSETGEKVTKVSKIPRLRFRAAVNKIRREQRSEDNANKQKAMVTNSNRRRSSIPRLKENKTQPEKEETERKRESINFDDLISNVTEADFDKIYEEIVETPHLLDESKNAVINKDLAIVETKFDEIIHAYDVNKIEPLKIDKSKSKIPLLKRKSEHDIEAKVVGKESQRKGSLGRIPISNSFGDKASSIAKSNIPQSNDSGNSLSRQAIVTTTIDQNSNNNLEYIDNSNVTPTLVTVTKIPLSQNKYAKISSVVLNKQPIRVNSIDNNKLKQTNEQTCNIDDNDVKMVDTEITLLKLEAKPANGDDYSITPNDTTDTKNIFHKGDESETDIKNENIAVNNDITTEINLGSENESIFNNNDAKISEDTNNIRSPQKRYTSTNIDFNSVANNTPKKCLSPELEIEHKKSENIYNIGYTKDDFIKETKNPPKINESEVVIKYKPEVSELETTKYVTNKNTDADNKNKTYHANESMTRKPVKYKTITATQNVEKSNEEDIIILKGKVNRVISRLDSMEPEHKKKPLDDLPKQSVKSKISLFECNDSKPASTNNKFSKSNLIQTRDSKPRVIEGILKDSDYIDDFKKSDKTQIPVNVENNAANDQVKIAYGFKDELVRWEKNNRNDTPYSKIPNTEYDLDKNNLNKSDINNIFHASKMNIRESPSAAEDEFAKKSADIINSYKLSQQKKNINVESDMKRAKSLAELDLGDAVTGTVKKMIHRMKSVDKIEHRKEIINSRERPRKGSVSERIALFEGRVPQTEPLKMALHEVLNSPPEAPDSSERLVELSGAAAKYGSYQNMSYVEVGGVNVPALWVGTAMMDSGVTKEVMKAAIDLGYRAFDTAYIYGTEREVGEAIREKIADGTVKREELFVAGKLWSTFHRSDLVEQVCRESLDKLGLDYFDLYMIHNPMSFKEGGHPIPMIANVLQYSEHDYLDAWYGIEDVVSKGLARAAGVSNFNTKQIQRILDKGKIKPVVNQVESHPYLTQLPLESFCSAHNIRLSVFGTLGSKGTPAAYKSGLSPAIDDPLVITMAAGLGMTPAQLLISYQLTLGRAVVVKCSSGARLWENLQAQASPLQPEHVRALHNLNRNQRTFTFKGMGDTHKNYPFAELV